MSDTYARKLEAKKSVEFDERSVKLPSKFYARPMANVMNAVESLIAYGCSGKLTHRCDVILWNCERVVQTVLLMKPGLEKIGIYYPSKVRSGKAVARDIHLEQLKIRLRHAIRMAVNDHFEHLRQTYESIIPRTGSTYVDNLDVVLHPSNVEFSPQLVTHTGVTYNTPNRFPAKKLPKDHFLNPIDNPDEDILQYCRDIDQWINDWGLPQNITPNDEIKANVQQLYNIHENADLLHAFARKYEPHTERIQKRNDVETDRINTVNREMFKSSVALAGAVLSSIVDPVPQFVLIDEHDDDQDVDIFEGIDIPTRDEVTEFYQEWYQKKKESGSELARLAVDSYTTLTEDVLDDDDDFFNEENTEKELLETIQGETTGDARSTDTETVETEEHVEITTVVEETLKRLAKACDEVDDVFSLNELVVLCASV